MKVCFFGSDPENYNRNTSWANALNKTGIKVEYCFDSKSDFFSKQYRLAIRFIKYHKSSDIILVGGFSHTNIPLAYLLGKIFRKPVLFAPLYSRYDTEVFDRKNIKEHSVKARIEKLVDIISVTFCDYLLLDTNQVIKFYHEKFNVPYTKMRRITIGTDEEIFAPTIFGEKKQQKVIYFGNFIPLHGIEYIIKAANILKNRNDIEFVFVGQGQEYNKAINMVENYKLNNIKFIDPVTPEELSEIIDNSTIGLGIFGMSDKAKRHIPNKLFQILAKRIPLITAKSPAVVEYLNSENSVLCSPGNPEEIAESILKLSDNNNFRKEIAYNGWEVYNENFSTSSIGSELKRLFQEINYNRGKTNGKNG
jgi:glycosyltransferase involved in cell wall biosynthesis